MLLAAATDSREDRNRVALTLLQYQIPSRTSYNDTDSLYSTSCYLFCFRS